MDKYTMFLKDGKITIKRAETYEDGCYIEVIGKEITLYEIPLYGGEEQEIGKYETILEAIEHSKTLT
jgi:hypothetical protein